MIYKPFQDKQLSALGMGTMRLPILNGNPEAIDKEHTARMVQYAFDRGVNYFDTAWGYHNGQSEWVMGEILSGYPRETYYLADKFPGYELENMPHAEEIFEKQLEKCRVEYFDFYLIHNVCELNIDAYLDPQYGIYDYFVEQKRKGRIKHLGFSNHGSVEVLNRFLEVYGDQMEFGQLQINWLDWEFQQSREKTAILEERGIPVWVMEPLRGGRLCKLDEEEEALLQKLRPEETTTGWAFRFLQSIPSVTVTLSGMSNFEQMSQNIATFETDEPLTADEMDALLTLGRQMTGKIALPCTGCRYCTRHCPQELDIPMLLELYNEHSFTGGGFLAPMALQALPESEHPSACIGCKSCEQVCPQGINIAAAMQDFCEKLK